MYRKGAKRERELIDLLKKHGFGAVRAAGSAAPDIIAGRNGKFYVIECKYSSKNVVYVPADEIAREVEIANKMGAIFLLAIKFSNEKWRFLKANMLEKFRRGKSIKVAREDARSLPSVELLFDKNLNEYTKS